MNPITDMHEQRDMPRRYSPIKHLDKKLRYRLTVYFIISFALVGIVIYHIIVDQVSTFFPLLGLAIGVGIGVVMSRMFHITWDHGAKKAISHMDEFGILILVVYIVFAFYRDDIIGRLVHGPAFVATSFAVLTGLMIGRLIGIRDRIKVVVTENMRR